jgi:hypothetical protein
MPSRSALNPVSFIRPGTGAILMPNDGTEPDPIIEKPLSSAIGMAASWKLICPGTGSTSAWAPPGKSVAASPRLRGKKRVPKVAMSRVADRANPKKHHRARPKWRALHFTLNLLRRWFRWFTTNAHRAQPAALRHKRALKALLRKAAETTLGFLERNRRRVRSQPANFSPIT